MKDVWSKMGLMVWKRDINTSKNKTFELKRAIFLKSIHLKQFKKLSLINQVHPKKEAFGLIQRKFFSSDKNSTFFQYVVGFL